MQHLQLQRLQLRPAHPPGCRYIGGVPQVLLDFAKEINAKLGPMEEQVMTVFLGGGSRLLVQILKAPYPGARVRALSQDFQRFLHPYPGTLKNGTLEVMQLG